MISAGILGPQLEIADAGPPPRRGSPAYAASYHSACRWPQRVLVRARYARLAVAPLAFGEHFRRGVPLIRGIKRAVSSASLVLAQAGRLAAVALGMSAGPFDGFPVYHRRPARAATCAGPLSGYVASRRR